MWIGDGKDGPRSLPDEAEMAQLGPKMAPRQPKLAQDEPEMGPRVPKIVPRWPHHGPKMAPRWPRDGSRGAQEELKRGPKRLQIGLPRLSNIEAKKGRLRINLKRPFWESLGPKNETPTVRFASF